MSTIHKHIIAPKLKKQSIDDNRIVISVEQGIVKESITHHTQSIPSVTYCIDQKSVNNDDLKILIKHVQHNLTNDSATSIEIIRTSYFWGQLSRWLRLDSRVFRSKAKRNRFSYSDLDSLLLAHGFRLFKRNYFSEGAGLLPKWLNMILNRFLLRLPILRKLNSKVMSRYTGLESCYYPTCHSVTVVIPARNESGNMNRLAAATKKLLDELPNAEVIFVEGNSQDDTYETCRNLVNTFPRDKVSLLKQDGKGKRDAVEKGFDAAKGDYLAIVDADLTVDLHDSIQAIKLGMQTPHRLINCARLNFPMEVNAMRFFNYLGNRFFACILGYICNQTISDSLCGTKCMSRYLYSTLKDSGYWDNAKDPFGDFSIIFGANHFGYEIINYPVQYYARTSGAPNISRWVDGVKLLKLSFIEYLKS